MSPNVLRTRSVQGGRGPGGRRRTGPGRVPEGGVRASEPGPGGGDQPLPQRDVLPPLPAPAPGPDPGLRPRGSNLHQQIHSRAVPERQGTEGGKVAFGSLWVCVALLSSLQGIFGNHERQPLSFNISSWNK